MGGPQDGLRLTLVDSCPELGLLRESDRGERDRGGAGPVGGGGAWESIIT